MNKLAEKIRVDIVRFDANTIERDLTEAAAELDRLTRELADARAVDVHSCHDKCTMPGCVNRRLRAEVAGLRAEVAGLREFVEHVRRNGSTHLANMAVAVLAARKGEA